MYFNSQCTKLGMNIINELITIASSRGITQKELAAKAGLNEENLSRMKKRGNGNIASVDRMAEVLGYKLAAVKKSPFPRLDHAASVWSSPKSKDDISMLYARLANASFKDLMTLADLHGIDVVEEHLDKIRSEMRQARYRLQKEMLNNIKAAYA